MDDVRSLLRNIGPWPFVVAAVGVVIAFAAPNARFRKAGWVVAVGGVAFAVARATFAVRDVHATVTVPQDEVSIIYR